MKKIFFIPVLVITLCLTAVRPARAEVDGDSPYQIAIIHPVQMIDKTKSIYGVRFNLVYGINYDVTGVDVGAFNRTTHYQKGLQVGIFNNTLKMTGLQIGLVNYTDFLDGVQIGVLNYHTQGMTDFFPFINWSF